MKKIVLATTAAAALALGFGAANADEPGVEKYFHERGNFDASMALKGPAPDQAGWPQYGYQQQAPGYAQGPFGYAPFGNPDYDD